MKKEIAARVRRGSTLLDKKVPGWYRTIALTANGGVHIDVKMYDVSYCILGQTFKDYFDGLAALGLTDHSGKHYGFDIASGEGSAGYNSLESAWEREVFRRLRKDTLGRITLEELKFGISEA